MNDRTPQSKTDEEYRLQIFQADLAATNDLRNAIYNYEFKTISNLQLINGGGASILTGFLTHPNLFQTPTIKILFILSIVSFVVGLFFSLILAFISPSFLEARYREDEGEHQNKKYTNYKLKRKWFLCCSSAFFFTAVIFAIISFLLAT